VVKTRLQLEARHLENNNLSKTVASAAGKPGIAGTNAVASKLVPAWTMTKDILSKEGIKGMYKGMSASYLGVSEGVIQ
jgi:solute carrier family 25 protein 33/36